MWPITFGDIARKLASKSNNCTKVAIDMTAQADVPLPSFHPVPKSTRVSTESSN